MMGSDVDFHTMLLWHLLKLEQAEAEGTLVDIEVEFKDNTWDRVLRASAALGVEPNDFIVVSLLLRLWSAEKTEQEFWRT